MPRVQRRDEYRQPKKKQSRTFQPAKTPEARENQLISLAVNQVEQQLVDGVASTAILVHFLKLATAKEQMERAKLESEVELLRAKAEAVNSNKEMKELYADALNAMTEYSPTND